MKNTIKFIIFLLAITGSILLLAELIDFDILQFVIIKCTGIVLIYASHVLYVTRIKECCTI